MGYSILDIAGATRRQAMQGMADVADQEQKREAANKNLKEAQRATTMGAIGTGAAVGGMVGGPWGAAAGAAIGLIASMF